MAFAIASVGRLHHSALMPRWLEILLTLALFAAVMAVVGAVLNATVPGIHAWLIERVGQLGFWTLLAAIIIPCAIIGYWPRNPDRTRRPLR